MTASEFLQRLLLCATSAQVDLALSEFCNMNATRWVAFGRENNRGTIEVASDSVRSAVERVTNAIDAVLEKEHNAHHGIPECKTPMEAAAVWLQVPPGGISAMSQGARQLLANRVQVTLADGNGTKEGRTLDVRDTGTGIAPSSMKNTILSLNESNKLEKFYLAGAYGQGGSSTFAFCDYALIASKKDGERIGFTIVKFDDLNPEKYKIGHYVYLVDDHKEPLEADLPLSDFAVGTLVRHFGFDFTKYNSPVGPTSVYGGLNTNLFDPVLPIWLNSTLHNYRRVIKGSRNALNGAVDTGDVKARGPDLDHRMPMFNVSMGSFGTIGIEYWVLAFDKDNTKPSAAFVNPSRPIVMTLNGQNHGDSSQLLIRKNAQLPFLSQRLVCHLDCNALSGLAKRQLFVSNREGGRDVQIRELIEAELLSALAADDELKRLNEEARRQGVVEKDETALQQMRTEVARLLKMQGLVLSGGGASGIGSEPGTTRTTRPPGPPPPPPVPIPVHEPPTYVKLIWGSGDAIRFSPGERRYLRVETDANTSYHNSKSPHLSRMNVIIPDDLTLVGTTELIAGRMRLIVRAREDAQVGKTDVVRIDLARLGLPPVSDTKPFEIVLPPPPKQGGDSLTVPEFDVIPIDGPDDSKWASLGWDADVTQTASEADLVDGVLTIYYSSVFPKFASAHQGFRAKNEASAQSFVNRYKVWLAAHSLLLYREQSNEASQGSVNGDELPEEATRRLEMAERRRIATLAVMMASREVKSDTASFDGE